MKKRMMKTKYENTRTHVNTHKLSIIRVTAFAQYRTEINTTAHAADARLRFVVSDDACVIQPQDGVKQTKAYTSEHKSTK